MFHTFSLLELIFLKVRHKSLFEPQLLLIWWEFISHFSYCSDEICDKGNLKKGGSQIERTICHGNDVMATGV